MNSQRWRSGAVIDAHAALAADATTTLNTAADCGALAFTIGAGEVWFFCAQIHSKSSTANGHKWAVNGPAGATLEALVKGSRGGVTTIISDSLVAIDTLSATIGTGSYATGGWVEIFGAVDNTAGSAGTVQVRFASAVAGDTLTAKKGSALHAWRQS